MIRYRVLKDFEDKAGNRYAEGDEVELEHEDAQAYVNRMMLTRELARKDDPERKPKGTKDL